MTFYKHTILDILLLLFIHYLIHLEHDILQIDNSRYTFITFYSLFNTPRIFRLSRYTYHTFIIY